MKQIYLFAFLILLGGCASSQINYNTLDIADNSRDLLTKQIVANFAAYISSYTALPSQLVVNGGSTAVTNTIGASISNPLSSMVQNTFSVASAATATVTATRQRTTAGAGMSVTGNNVSGQTYSFDTITDYEKMHRLNALYRYAVTWSELGREGDALFIAEFPLYRKSVSHTKQECTSGFDTASGRYKAPIFKNTGLDEHDHPETLVFCATSATTSGNYSHSSGSAQFTTQIPDETYLMYPTCIVCGSQHHLAINSQIAGPWLAWRDITGEPVPLERAANPGDQYIGTAGRFEFFVRRGQEYRYVNYAMAILAASTQTSAAIAGGAGGGNANQPSSPKASTPYELSIPVLQ